MVFSLNPRTNLGSISIFFLYVILGNNHEKKIPLIDFLFLLVFGCVQINGFIVLLLMLILTNIRTRCTPSQWQQ